MTDQLAHARHVVLHGHLYSATMRTFAWSVLKTAQGHRVRQSRTARIRPEAA